MALDEVDETLLESFLRALQKPDATVPSRSAALAGFLPELRSIYANLAATPTVDPSAKVHERLNIYCRSVAAYQQSTASQLLHECRALRRVLPQVLTTRNADAAHVGLVHAMVDACVAYIVDGFVHEEELLRTSRAQFSVIIDAIPQLVWRTTVDGEATFANKRFLEHVGCSLDEVLGWGWLSFIHPDDSAKVAAEWARCRAAEIPVQVTFRVRGTDGSYRWFLSLGNAVRDDSNTIVAYYGTWTDIDEQKRIESELLRAVHARDEFLSIASHELKTPLTALQLQVQMRCRALKRGTSSSVPVDVMQTMLANDAHQIARITRLVNDMLDVARLDSGKLTLLKETVNLSDLVREVVERQRPLLEVAGCAVHVHCDAAVVGEWDPFRIEQAVANLLNNSCRYAAHAPIEVAVTQLSGKARIRVADKGPGIAPQDHERVFGRFERAISANESSGLGLGLYIVRQIVEMHHGQIALESQLGHGSTFIIEMPIS